MTARTFGSILAVFCVLGCSSAERKRVGGAGAVDASCESPANDVESHECDVLMLVNQARAQGASCGGQTMPAVPPLAMHPILRGTARAHAEDMAAKNYFQHTNLDGVDPFERIEQAGYDFSTAGENIAAGNATAQGAMQSWMQSQQHCENIMKARYEHIGVGYAHSASHEHEHLWVQNFGAL